MKAKEIRELNTTEISQRIKEEQDQLRQLKFQHAVAALENPALLAKKRRLVARLKTILKEKEQGEAAA